MARIAATLSSVTPSPPCSETQSWIGTLRDLKSSGPNKKRNAGSAMTTALMRGSWVGVCCGMISPCRNRPHGGAGAGDGEAVELHDLGRSGARGPNSAGHHRAGGIAGDKDELHSGGLNQRAREAHEPGKRETAAPHVSSGGCHPESISQVHRQTKARSASRRHALWIIPGSEDRASAARVFRG